MLLFNSRLRLFPGKIKSKLSVLYLITQLVPHGAELEKKEGVRFKVNGQRIKIYLMNPESTKELIEACHLYED